MSPTRVLRTLLAERLGQTAGRWPRELFGEAEAPTLRQAIAERAGFDGIVADPNAEMGASGSRPHVVVFDPENVRSQHGSSSTAPDAGPRRNDSTLAGLAALPPGALTLRELLRDRYGAA